MNLPALLPLQRIARIGVPPASLEHYHVYEASAAAAALRSHRTGFDEAEPGVVGTQDNKRAEVYAWVNPVRPHVDGNGRSSWMYGALLKGPCTVSAGRDSVDLVPGDVFRLNDRQLHWTAGRCDSVCVFAGCWHQPRDEHAVTLLERGIAKLAAGVRNAPRAAPGFRFRRRDEVWASPDYKVMQMVSVDAAKRFDMDIALCKDCGGYADTVDDKYPYFLDHSCNACEANS